MKVFIWSPSISSQVGTIKTVLNTAKCLKKYSKKKIDISLLNVANEWVEFKNFVKSNNINLINLNGKLDFKSLPSGNFFKSRLTYLIVSILSIIDLHKIIKSEKPNYLIFNLITFVPLFLLNFFSYRTRFILRISGYPKLNILRSFFWKISNKKIYRVFCPTNETKKQLIKNKIFSEDKIIVVNEPILDLSIIRKKKNEKIDFDFKKFDKYIISIGRLSDQKNHKFMINNFDKILEKHPDLKLLICGDGENKKELQKLIYSLKRENNIILLGYCENIYQYLKKSLFFLLTSEWEDPGFVIIETMFSNKVVLSSNCKNGPIELIDNSKNGFLYKKGDSDNFNKTFKEVLGQVLKDETSIKEIKINAKKMTRRFTLFNHYKLIKNHLTEF